jgi:hypothetical protein
MILTRWRAFVNEIAAFIIILLASGLRIALIAQGWPGTDSDEATMGLMATHIAYRGELPVFFYGQSHIGTLEAFLGAVLFHILGPSLFSLRLGVVLLFALFLVSMYLLTSLFYSKRLALVTLVLLSLGSNTILFRELSAEGGHPETPLFGSLLLLFTTWVALSSVGRGEELPPGKRKWRNLLYGLWGCMVGASLWNDLLAIPFIVIAGLFLWLYCRAELRKSTVLSILIGMGIALMPMILYNFTVPITNTSLSVIGMVSGVGLSSAPPSILKDLTGTILVSLPIALGAGALCNIPSNAAWPLSLQSSPQTLRCTAVHGAWGLGFIVLFLIAFLLAAKMCWQSPYQLTSQTGSSEERRATILRFARLAVLGSAGLSLLIFALGPQPYLDPLSATRFLVALRIATPAILWPIWRVGDVAGRLPRGMTTLLKLGKYGLLLCVGITLLIGSIQTFTLVPAVQGKNQQERAFVHDLLRMGATHIYTDYWTCDLIIFLSQEQIICAVLDEHLQPGFDRYTPYAAIVRHDPHAFYVFSEKSPQASACATKMAGGAYQLTVVDNYDVYHPIDASADYSDANSFS